MRSKLILSVLVCCLSCLASCEKEEKEFQSTNLYCQTTKGNLLLFKTTSNATCDLTGFETPDSIMEELILPSQLFYDNHVLQVTRIAPYAFSWSNQLRSVEVPDGVTAIGREAFRGCTSLERVVLPDGVKSIGYCCFMDCEKLNTINLPSSITTIDNMAFEDCHSLQHVRFEASIDTLHWGVFQGCDSLREISLPESLRIVEGAAFYHSGLRELIFPEGVTTVLTDVVNQCYDLKHISFPSTVETLNLQHMTCDNLEYMDVKALTPPYLYINFHLINRDMKVRVPAESLEAYQNAEVWRGLSIEALPE